jgi:hypothetical protein
MPQLILLTDYQGQFGEKRYSVPYRSGMDLSLLTEYFGEAGYEIQILGLSDVDLRTMDFTGRYVLCGSAQDHDCLYKSYLEDICLALELHGAVLIPAYKYIRAHHNKVFMELLRDTSALTSIKNIRSYHFGTLEELRCREDSFKGPCVIKGAEGAGSRRVQLARNVHELVRYAEIVSRSRSTLCEIKDIGRAVKHKGYLRESKFRKKFIVQNLVDGLSNDWKVLVFGAKYYVLHRATRDNDFRASGSGKFQFREDVPDGMLSFAAEVYQSFSVPSISIDVAFDGNQFYLLEFQCVHFGSTTIEKSPFYFVKSNSGWCVQRGTSVLEQEYVNSVVAYVGRLERQANVASAL